MRRAAAALGATAVFAGACSAPSNRAHTHNEQRYVDSLRAELKRSEDGVRVLLGALRVVDEEAERAGAGAASRPGALLSAALASSARAEALAERLDVAKALQDDSVSEFTSLSAYVANVQTTSRALRAYLNRSVPRRLLDDLQSGRVDVDTFRERLRAGAKAFGASDHASAQLQDVWSGLGARRG